MLKKVLDLATANGLLKKQIVPKYNINHYKIGPVGLLLYNNLYTEWFNSIVINKDITVVLNNGNINETYDYAKSLCSEKLPFGIADTKKLKPIYNTDETIEYYKNASNSDIVDFKDLLREEDEFLLNCCVFVSPSESTRVFHQWQKQRRIWYRKFSASPERYFVSDIKSKGNIQSADISAKYPWGTQILESLELNTNNENFTNQQLQFKDRKYIYAHTICSKINLPILFLNALCDSYEEPLFQDKLRPLWKFHRKIAPYKISFALTGTTTSITNELSDLALYICKQLRNVQVSTLFLPSSSRNTLESQFRQYDQLGVPYTIVLNERTLKDGIIGLRSRDTTLKEQVHVTDLVAYVEKLFKNY